MAQVTGTAASAVFENRSSMTGDLHNRDVDVEADEALEAAR
jgi:hypothetical protein